MDKMIYKIKHLMKNNRFAGDVKGVAAIEFAFIAPVLILLFIGTLEVSYAVAVDRKISRVSSSVADLVTQTDTHSKSTLNPIMNIADRIIYPYAQIEGALSIVLVGITIADGQARVEWSHNNGTGTKPAEGSVITVPESIKIDGTALVSATVSVEHEPAFAFIGYKNGKLSFSDRTIALSEQMFLRPRTAGADGVICTDCD